MAGNPPGLGTDGADTITEVTRTGWLARLRQSLVGVLAGCAMVIFGFCLLYWNEGRAIVAVRALNHAARVVVEVHSGAIDSHADRQLVHLSGMMQSAAPARDPLFGASAASLVRLRRSVQMYQWQEDKSTSTQNQTGGAQIQTTTYSYRREWSGHAIDSSNFHTPAGHQNPPMLIESATYDGGGVRLGAYAVDSAVLAHVQAFAPLAVQSGWGKSAGFQPAGDFLYRGQNPASPAIGDMRVSFAGVGAQPMSVIAEQDGGRLTAYYGADGYRIALAHPGDVPAAEMFREEKTAVREMLWIVRLIGFAVMVIGFLFIAQPLAVLAGVLPFLGSLVEAGAFVAAILLAIPLSFLAIALAWLRYRPVISIAILAAGIALAAVIRNLHRTARPKPASSPSPG